MKLLLIAVPDGEPTDWVPPGLLVAADIITTPASLADWQMKGSILGNMHWRAQRQLDDAAAAQPVML